MDFHSTIFRPFVGHTALLNPPAHTTGAFIAAPVDPLRTERKVSFAIERENLEVIAMDAGGGGHGHPYRLAEVIGHAA